VFADRLALLEQQLPSVATVDPRAARTCSTERHSVLERIAKCKAKHAAEVEAQESRRQDFLAKHAAAVELTEANYRSAMEEHEVIYAGKVAMFTTLTADRAAGTEKAMEELNNDLARVKEALSHHDPVPAVPSEAKPPQAGEAPRNFTEQGLAPVELFMQMTASQKRQMLDVMMAVVTREKEEEDAALTVAMQQQAIEDEAERAKIAASAAKREREGGDEEPPLKK
jgi:hypothetical protein